MTGRSSLTTISLMIPAFCAFAPLACGVETLLPSPSPLASATPATSPTANPISSPAMTPSPSASPSPDKATTKSALIPHDIPGIKGKIAIPGDWTYLPGKLLEGDVLLAVREKISDENDQWSTGLTMTLDKNGAADSGMKAGDYAMGIACEAREKAGEESSPITESTNGVFRDIRFEFPIQGDTPLVVTELLRANEKTGTVAVILWQSPKAEGQTLRPLRDLVLTGITLDPAL